MWKRILFLVVAGTLLLSCSTTYLGRYVSCGLTSNKDFEQFPTREIANGPDVFAFSDDAGARSQSLDRLEPIHYTFQGEARTAHLETLLEESGSSAFVVIQDDTILYEEYFNGYSRDSFNTSASVAKSFVSALIGIAIEEGLIGSVDDPIIQYLPELEDEGVDGVTIRQLLTMSSGFEHTWGLAPWHDLVRSYYSPDLSVGTASAPTTPEWAKRSVPQLKSGSSPPPTLCSWPPVHTEYRKLPVLMDSLFAIPERQAESLLVCRSTGSETLRRQHHGFSMRPALFNSLTCLTTQQRIINSLQPEAQMNRFRDPKRVVAFAIALATLQGCVSSTTSVSNSDIVVESGIVFATIDGVSLELDLWHSRPIH